MTMLHNILSVHAYFLVALIAAALFDERVCSFSASSNNKNHHINGNNINGNDLNGNNINGNTVNGNRNFLDNTNKRQQNGDDDDPPIHTLLLCRHGDSIWNGGCEGQVEVFTGWTDVPLSKQGMIEAQKAAHQLRDYLYDIDVCFTSILSRAQVTLQTCLQGLSKPPASVYIDARLNERHYGALQGLVKAHVEAGKYGHDPLDVQAWRRHWHARPPVMDENDPRRLDELQQFGHLANFVPNGESLQMVADQRIRPFIEQVLLPTLDEHAYKNQQEERQQYVDNIIHSHSTGLVVAHANSLRALLGVLCNVEDDQDALRVLESIRIPTGVPLVLQFQAFTTCDNNNNNGNVKTITYRPLSLPNTIECLIHDDDNDWWAHPNEPPPPLGHVKLPVWPLNRCIPLEQTKFATVPTAAAAASATNKPTRRKAIVSRIN